MLSEFRRLFRLPPRERDLPADTERELEFHLAMRTDELVAAGMDPETARAEAIRRFGDLTGARSEIDATRRADARRRGVILWWTDLVRDVRFAVRSLRRTPVFSATALTVLAMAVGLTTAMISVLDRLVLHPLPYRDADRLGLVWLASGSREHSIRLTPTWNLLEAWTGGSSFERIEAYRSTARMLESEGFDELVPTTAVSPGLLPMLGARIVLGRGIGPADTAAAAEPVVLLSEGAWRERFGDRSDVIGRIVRLGGSPAVIVGVVGSGFDLSPIDRSARAELWLPLRRGDGDNVQVVAKLRKEVAFGAAAGELAAITRPHLQARGSTFESFSPVLMGAGELAGTSLRRTLYFLIAAVALVLVVACANVAALLLGQAAGRQREFGIRAALGAGRARVVRQLVTEAVVLGAGGGALGVLVTWALLALARELRPASLVHLDRITIEPATLAVAIGVALLTATVFALAPIWAVSRQRAAAHLVGRTRRPDGVSSARLRTGLVVGQLALSLVLMVGAGLLLKSFLLETTLPRGFDQKGLGHLWLSFPEELFPSASRRDELAAALVERARAVPGVTAVAASGNGPLDFGVTRAEFLVEGTEWPETSSPSIFPVRAIGPDFLPTLRLPLLAGRMAVADSNTAEILIDEPTARRYFPGGAALGRRVAFDRAGTEWVTVVGIVAEQRGLAASFETAPMVYRPAERGELGSFLIRSSSPQALGTVAALARQLDPGIRVRGVSTVEASLEAESAASRFAVAVVLVFAFLAVGLAAVGLYGVIAFAVTQRGYEIGVRMALGAGPGAVRRMVLREGLIRVAVGGALGGAAAFGLARLLRSILYQTAPWDPVVFIVAVVLLGGAGLAAAWVPAWRAGRIDPQAVLRAE